jgi:hypothetical protein
MPPLETCIHDLSLHANEVDDEQLMLECDMDELIVIKETRSTRRAYGWVPAIAAGAMVDPKHYNKIQNIKQAYRNEADEFIAGFGESEREKTLLRANLPPTEIAHSS